jgi:hypothetical protein
MRDGTITHSFCLPSRSICAGTEGQKRGVIRGQLSAMLCVSWINVAW